MVKQKRCDECGGPMVWQKRNRTKDKVVHVKLGVPYCNLGPKIHAYVCRNCGKADR